MKGLLIKDTKIILNQKRFLILFLFVAVVLSFSMDSSFIVSYIPMIGVIMILSTISYDYHDEGFSFLMTMPIKPGDYAVAKYVFTILGVSVFWVISVMLQFASFFIQKTPFDLTETIMADVCMLPLFLLIASIVIPIDIKFSPEKVRVIMFLIYGVIMVAFLGGKALLGSLAANNGIDMASKLEALDSVNPVFLILALAAFCIICLSISMTYSIRLMQKREF